MRDINRNLMNKRFLITVLAVITVPLCLRGQPYEHAAGIRAGYTSGITYKGFLRYSMSAFQLDAGYNRRGLHLSAQYQFHWEPFRNKRWMVCSGGGIFSGEWDDELSAGLMATVGMEFVMRDLPLNFGLDWRPQLNLYRNRGIDLLDLGLSIRYRFGM